MLLGVIFLICEVAMGLEGVRNGVSNARDKDNDARWFRIVGGSRAEKREFPFIASLQNSVCSIQKVYHHKEGCLQPLVPYLKTLKTQKAP